MEQDAPKNRDVGTEYFDKSTTKPLTWITLMCTYRSEMYGFDCTTKSRCQYRFV
jgi:hypothetical protein